MEKNLGHATAYGYAKSKGYSGTEDEFAELMADYASVGQSAAQSAEQAAASATSASGSATTASQAAQTATSKASEAVTAADTATTKASEANQSASTASAAATSAGTSAQTATTAASTATTKASEASESATTASAAKTDAETARDAAAQSASEAAESARTLTIDATLTQAGQAADAKATGEIKNRLGNVHIAWIENYYIKSNGAQEAYSKYSCTDFIPLYGGVVDITTRVIKNDSYLAIAFYDAEKHFISGLTNPSSETYTFSDSVTIPANAKYARCSCVKAGINQYFKFEMSDYIGSITSEVMSNAASTSKNEASINNLKIAEVDFADVTLELTTGKYVYVGATPGNNDGTIQNSANKAYMSVIVSSGDALKISGYAQPNAPILTFFSDYNIGHANYIGAYEILSGNKTYAEEFILIPDGCVMVVVSFSAYTTSTNAIKKSYATKVISQLWNAGYVGRSEVSEYIAMNPLEYRGRQASVFNNILCIGDSLTQGGENNPPAIVPDPSHATRTPTDQQYSYPAYLKKLWGCETTNWGLSGKTSVDWYNLKENEDWTGHDCAVVFLGSNDSKIAKGDAEACITANNTALRNIITRFQTDNYGAPVFICTLFKGWNDLYGVSEGVVSNIRTISEELDGVYLLDLRAWSKVALPSVYTNTHPVAIGYQKLAEEIGGGISWYINNYPEQFRWLRWVGTDKAVSFNN